MTSKKIINFHGKMMINLAKELYPINRSITGEGLRKTISLIQKKVHLKRKFFKSEKKYLIGLSQRNGILKMDTF